MELSFRQQTLRFRSPVVTAFGTIDSRETLLVKLTDQHGSFAYGEAAPLEQYDGVSLTSVISAIAQYQPQIVDLPPLLRKEDHDDLLKLCATINPLPQALAAVDIAGWNLLAQQTKRSIISFFHPNGEELTPPFCNATVTEQHPQDVARAAQHAVAGGFHCLKLKVGFPNDQERIIALRQAVGDGPGLRLDANGSWDVQTAIEKIQQFEEYQLELVEEPVSGIEELRAVYQAVDVPIAMDETAVSSEDILSGASDAVCLKVSRCGGISATVDSAHLARKHGCEPYIASTFDGPLGLAAGKQAAQIVQPRFACGLATLNFFTSESLTSYAKAVG